MVTSARSVDLQNISIGILCGEFQRALSVGTLRKVTSYDHTIVSRSAMENSKPVSWIPKQTNWLSDIKQVIWEILQIHTWDLLPFVTENLES